LVVGNRVGLSRFVYRLASRVHLAEPQGAQMIVIIVRARAGTINIYL